MHCKIIEIVPDLQKPLRKGKWAKANDLPESFVGEIADYTNDVDEEYAERLKDSFVEDFGGHCVRDGDWITFDEEAKKVDVEDRYKEFIETAKALSEMSLDDFCGLGDANKLDHMVWLLGDRYEDKFGLYVFDSAACDLTPYTAWMRRMVPGKRYFMGSVMDYHW